MRTPCTASSARTHERRSACSRRWSPHDDRHIGRVTSAPMSATEHAPGLFIRGFVPPLRLSDFRLIAFDMDSTLINIECVDEIADAAGRRAEVAEITEAAMRGEIADYKDSLRRRVALLAGVPVSALEKVWADKLRLNPGVQAFVEACQAA